MPPKPFLPQPPAEIEARRVRSIPPLQAFTSAVDQTLSSPDEDAFWRCRPFFETLCRSGFERELIHYELRRMNEDPDYTPLGSMGQKLTIVSGSRYLLLLVLNTPADNPGTAYSTFSEHRMLGVLGPGRLSARLYRQPDGVRNEVFDRSATLLPCGDVDLGPGDVATFAAGRDVIGPRSCDGPVLTVLFGSKVCRSLLWEYDPATLRPLRALAVETSSSRLQYTARLFAVAGGKATLPGLRRMSEHREHFVRWSALQAIMSIDPAEGAARLEEAVSDSHPHVRNAAVRSLAKLRARGVVTS